MNNMAREEEDEEEEEEEDDDDDEDEEDGAEPGATSFEDLSPACSAMLKRALVAQVRGQAEQAVQMYLMTFKMHPTAAPKFRDEFLNVLKLHLSRLAGRGTAASGLPLCRLAASVLPKDTEVITLLGRTLFVAGQEGEARRQCAGTAASRGARWSTAGRGAVRRDRRLWRLRHACLHRQRRVGRHA